MFQLFYNLFSLDSWGPRILDILSKAAPGRWLIEKTAPASSSRSWAECKIFGDYFRQTKIVASYLIWYES